MIGLNTGGLYGGDDETRIRKFIDETGVTFPIASDGGRSYGSFSAGPGISPFPLDVVIGRDGRIVYLTREYDAGALKAAVEAAL